MRSSLMVVVSIIAILPAAVLATDSVDRMSQSVVLMGDLTGDSDCMQCYKIKLDVDQMLYVDVDAHTLGSALDSVVEIYRLPQADMMIRNDDEYWDASSDSQLMFRVPIFQNYLICISDHNNCADCMSKDELAYAYFNNETDYDGPFEQLVDRDDGGSDFYFNHCWYYLNIELRFLGSNERSLIVQLADALEESEPILKAP